MSQILGRFPADRFFPVDQIIRAFCSIHEKIGGIKLCVDAALIGSRGKCVRLFPGKIKQQTYLLLFIRICQIAFHISAYHLLALFQYRSDWIFRHYQMGAFRKRNAVYICKTSRCPKKFCVIIQCMSRQIFHNHNPICKIFQTSIYIERTRRTS